jgi:hypothetical protein
VALHAAEKLMFCIRARLKRLRKKSSRKALLDGERMY